jgi:hypothetical protein
LTIEERIRKYYRQLAKVPHGTMRYRNYGCRCQVCTEASRRYMHDYYERVTKPKRQRRNKWLSIEPASNP